MIIIDEWFGFVNFFFSWSERNGAWTVAQGRKASGEKEVSQALKRIDGCDVLFYRCCEASTSQLHLNKV